VHFSINPCRADAVVFVIASLKVHRRKKKNAMDFHSIPILGEFLAYFLTRFDRAFKPERIIRSGGAKSTRNGEEREVV